MDRYGATDSDNLCYKSIVYAFHDVICRSAQHSVNQIFLPIRWTDGSGGASFKYTHAEPECYRHHVRFMQQSAIMQ